MQRNKGIVNEKRCRWTFGELLEMEFGPSCNLTPHTSSGVEPEKCRPGAATPLDGGVDKNMEPKSTARRIQPSETGDKPSSTGNGGVA